MAGTVVADTIQADSTSTLVLKNGVANTPPTIQDSAGTQIGTFCRAWVNFNGTTNVGGFCTIRASFNVTTVADNGTGVYTINFTNAMPDTNFAMVGTSGALSPASGFSITMGNNTYTTSSAQVYTTNNVAAVADNAVVSVAFFR